MREKFLQEAGVSDEDHLSDIEMIDGPKKSNQGLRENGNHMQQIEYINTSSIQDTPHFPL